MDEIIEVLEEYEEVQFLVSLDYSSNEADLYSCSEWADLYSELGQYNNNPFILDTDTAEGHKSLLPLIVIFPILFSICDTLLACCITGSPVIRNFSFL